MLKKNVTLKKYKAYGKAYNKVIVTLLIKQNNA